MKLKKILAAALSAAMVLSCMTVSGGNVVQAAGETANRGVNIAPELEIVAYSGQDSADHSIEYVNDTVNNNNDDNQRWQSKEELKGGGSLDRGNAAYIIFDLGADNAEGSIRSYSEIRVKFHNQAYATNYKILTSDECNYKGTENTISRTGTPEGWEEVTKRTFKNGGLGAWPENVFNKEEKQDKTTTKRYLMFFFTSMNSSAGAKSVSIREIEIYKRAVENITIDGDASSNLELDVTPTKRLTATVAPENASNKGVTWSSANPEIATVDPETGLVTAVAPGTATIKATSKDDATKTATHTVNVCADKTELRSLIQFADGLDASKYMESTWEEFTTTRELARDVLDNEFTADSERVSDATDALLEAINALERKYTVTVDGKVHATGPMNTPCTIIAKDQEGKTFAGWKLNGNIVSVEKEYTFYICGDMSFKAVYEDASVEPEKPLSANMTGIVLTERPDGKANVKFVAQLSIPEGYTLNETGLFWSIKDGLNSLHTGQNEPVSGAKKVNVSRISSTYQFAVNVNGLPVGKTIYGEVYAKVTNKNNSNDVRWIYSTLESATHSK